jgi:uncharacterized protein YdgA (DUF945 family)
MPIQSSFSSLHNHIQHDALPCRDNPLGIVTFISPNLIPSTPTHSQQIAAAQSGMAQFDTSNLKTEGNPKQLNIKFKYTPCLAFM